MDNQVFGALRELLLAAPVINRNVFIVGGTALWDWWYDAAPLVHRAGGFLEEPRITKDLDLSVERQTIQVAGDPEALRVALVDNGWSQIKANAFVWSHPKWKEVTIEILTHKNRDEQVRPVWIRDKNENKVIQACSTLKRLEPLHGLLEECRHESIAEFRISRFTQLGLLLSKLVAIANVLQEFREAERENREPRSVIDRLGKDRYDALLLLRRSVRSGIVGLSARYAMNEHSPVIDEELASILILQKSIPAKVPANERDHLLELSHVVDQWLGELNS